MESNIFIVPHINVIGGVEAFLYYIAKKYKARDITVYYRWGDYKQLDRLERLVRVKRLGEKIKCKRVFFAYDIRDIDDIEAEEYIQIVHADFKAQNIKPNLNPKITKYYAVSKTAEKGKERMIRLARLLTNPPKVDFKLPADKWGKMLTSDKSTYKPPKGDMVTVTAILKYTDIKLNRLVNRGERLRVTPERAKELIAKGVCE